VKNRKSIWNHERGGRTVEKHAETEATEKSSKHSKPVPGSSVGGREAEDTITR
jgi:hypothetical protein